MIDSIIGWEYGNSQPVPSAISPQDYVTISPRLNEGLARKMELSRGKAYKALLVEKDNLSGELQVDIQNDKGYRESYPAELFDKAPLIPGDTLRIAFFRTGTMDGGSVQDAGVRYDWDEYKASALSQEETMTEIKQPQSKPGPRMIHNYHSPVSAFGVWEFFSEMSPGEHKLNWKANSFNLPRLRESERIVYGVSSRATVKLQLDPDLTRFIDIVPGESYRVTGYLEKFLDGEKGVMIINERGKRATYKLSLFV